MDDEKDQLLQHAAIQRAGTKNKLCPAATHGAGSGDQASGFLLLLLRSFLHVGSY